jgi:hypothetical protein
MNQLLKHVGVFPELEQMLCSFGIKTFAMDEAFSACELSLQGSSNGPVILGKICSLVFSLSSTMMVADYHTQRRVVC